MDSEEMKFVEKEIAELRARAEHYRVLHEKLLRHCDEIDRLHKNEIRSLAAAIEGMQERIAAIQERWEYEKRRADANWKALLIATAMPHNAGIHRAAEGRPVE